MFVDVRKSHIVSRYFLHGQKLVDEISKLASSAVSAPITNLLGLRMMPLGPQMSNHSTVSKKLSVRFSAQKKSVFSALIWSCQG